MRITMILFLLLSLALPGQAAAFSLASDDVRDGATLGNHQILNGFGCSGDNLSPELHWRDAPANTKSFAVTVYDPDAPTGSGWWHWVVVDIPATVDRLAAGAGGTGGKLPPEAVQVRTDFGKPGFGGACPPKGDRPHRYVFTVHALDVERLDLPPDATAAMAGFLIGQHRLGQATLIAHYGR